MLISVLLSVLRNVLGGIIAFLDVVSRGPKLKRDKAQQAIVNKQAQDLSLYQFFACPFCIKTRRVIHQLNIPIEKKSISKGTIYRQELLEQGGKIQAPCLRIEENTKVEWLYDSKDIIDYLNQRFANKSQTLEQAN